MKRLYYTKPPRNVFNEVKKAAIEIWSTYDDTYGYASEKINTIKGLKNIGDNFMYIVAMFDINNQRLLAGKLSAEAKNQVSRRIIDGGGAIALNPFYEEGDEVTIYEKCQTEAEAELAEDAKETSQYRNYDNENA